jgi:hypothetical protein
LKRPAFQFYPADWRKDVELRSCSVAARGLWIDMLCIAHECEPYGHLTVNGRPMTCAQIAGQVGLTAAQCKTLIDELVENGVARRTDDGTLYNKRMVEDEDLRNRRAEGGKAGSEHGHKGAQHGSKGGRPKKETGDKKPPSHPPSEPPPSSSSSSSASAKNEALADTPPPLRAPAGQDAQQQDGEGTGKADTSGHAPTQAGAICRAMRQAGMQQTNPGDPRFLALVAQGATEAEFVSLAEEAKRRGINAPWPWVLKVLPERRAEAAAINLAPAATSAPVDPMAWTKSRSAVIDRANRLGIGPFDEVAAHVGTGPSWAKYRADVIAASERQGATQ